MLECVINIAEGRDEAVLAEFAGAAGPSLRDRHSDPDHHRSVYTLINAPDALARDVRALARTVIGTLDLRRHDGVHPRLGVLDVVPFVPLEETGWSTAVALRDETARWLADDLAVPVFLYGPLSGAPPRSLPEIRRRAFRDLLPDLGPREPDPRTGAACVGARGVLVAWNLWLSDVPLARTRDLAASLRSPAVRTLAFRIGRFTQVSCNLVDPSAVRPSTLFDAVVAGLPAGGRITRCELVGLAPRALLAREDPARLAELGFSDGATIETRLGG